MGLRDGNDSRKAFGAGERRQAHLTARYQSSVLEVTALEILSPKIRSEVNEGNCSRPLLA